MPAASGSMPGFTRRTLTPKKACATPISASAWSTASTLLGRHRRSISQQQQRRLQLCGCLCPTVDLFRRQTGRCGRGFQWLPECLQRRLVPSSSSHRHPGKRPLGPERGAGSTAQRPPVRCGELSAQVQVSHRLRRASLAQPLGPIGPRSHRHKAGPRLCIQFGVEQQQQAQELLTLGSVERTQQGFIGLLDWLTC
jgi:hypothetical protein